MTQTRQQQMRLRASLIVGMAVLAALLPGCTPATRTPATQPAAASREQISPWKPIFRGVEMCETSTDTPRPLQIRAVRVHLRDPTVDFLVTPSNGDEPQDCAARTTSEFLTEFKCQVAINGSFFGPFAKAKGDPQDVVGLSLSRGDRYSPPNKWDALLISKDRRVWIDVSPIDASRAYNGLSGHRALLIDGRVALDPNDKSSIVTRTHPRSAAGISEDGRYLILMTIDGRQPGYSEGTTLAETAEWIGKLGAHDALNLDGGGSTTLVMAGADGEPVVLNRPSGQSQRRVANHLGVFAARRPTP